MSTQKLPKRQLTWSWELRIRPSWYLNISKEERMTWLLQGKTQLSRIRRRLSNLTSMLDSSQRMSLSKFSKRNSLRQDQSLQSNWRTIDKQSQESHSPTIKWAMCYTRMCSLHKDASSNSMSQIALASLKKHSRSISGNHRMTWNNRQKRKTQLGSNSSSTT